MYIPKILTAFVSFIILYQLIGIYNISAYSTDFFFASNSSSPQNVTNTTYFVDIIGGSCYNTIRSNVFAQGSSYSITESFYDNTGLLTSYSTTKTGNITCSFMGETNSTFSDVTNHHTYINSISTATYYITSKNDKLTCDAYSISLLSNDTLRTNGYVITDSACGNRDNCASAFFSYYTPCGYNGSAVLKGLFAFNLTSGQQAGYLYPFNSGSGNVIITADLDDDCGYGGNQRDWYLYQIGSLTETSLGADSISYSGVLSENTNYVLVGICTRNPASTQISPPTVNITITTYEADWSCGSYGECLNGSKYRLCTDTNGILPDKLESETCYSLPEKTMWLGMENSTTENVWFTQPTWWCLPETYLKAIEYPLDWKVNPTSNPFITNNRTGVSVGGYVYDNIMLTKETAREGVYSLKMWNIPPERWIPYCPNNNTGSWLNLTGYFGKCVNGSTTELFPDGNYSFSLTPQVDKLMNQSYLVAHDLTFSYPNMTVSLSAKRCADVVQQYSGNSSLFGVCGEGFYTSDKSSSHSVKDTKLFLSIYDLNTSTNVYTTYLDVINEKNWKDFNLMLVNLDTTHNYRFSIGMYDDIVSGSNYCAYVDNIYLNAYSGSVLCESQCIGRTYYELISQNGLGCAYNQYPNDKRCFDSDWTVFFDSCGTKCSCDKTASDYLTLYTGNNESGECVISSIANSDYCESYCKTQNIKSPMDSIKARLDTAGLSWAGGFFSPFFIIIIIMIVIAFLVGYFLESWEAFIAVAIIEILIASFLWIEFAFIGIIIVVVLAIYVAKMIMSNG